MLNSLRMSPAIGEDIRSAVLDLLKTTSRQLVYLVVALSLAGQFIGMVLLPDHLSRKIDAMTLIVLPVGVLSLMLLGRRAWMAQAVWQLGLAAVIVYGMYAFLCLA